MKARYLFLDQECEIAPRQVGRGATFEIGGEALKIEQPESSVNGQQRIVINGRVHHAWVARRGGDIYVHFAGEAWHVQAVDPIEAAGSNHGASTVVRAPMPGAVISVGVSVGETVHEGQILMVIESMKLQTSIVADRDGSIAEICFDPEDTFEKGVELLRFAAAEDKPGKLDA